MKRLEWAPLLHVLTSLVALALGYWLGPRIPWAKGVYRALGQCVLLVGTAAFAWAAACLGKSFFGNVQPVSDRLVTGGPYRWVRHPLYLGMIIMLLGLVIMLGSVLGVGATLLLFLPASVCRARQEEQALAARFGQEWRDYAGRTGLLIPRVW